MKTIHDYLKMAQELRDLGQQLVQEQYRGSDKPAEWVEELECMNIHLECCIYELSWK